MQRHGFSLVELSIVLVIIGLLVGGIMAGSSLIRNSEVKTVITEYNQYKQAALSFRSKYAALPGDLTDASSYWATANNGNGDGQIAAAGGGAGLTAEWAQFWSQLALTGSIEGSFSGLAGSVGGSHMVIGTNVPKATLTNAGWGTFWVGNWIGDANNFAYDYGNVLTLGGNTGLNSWPYTSVLKPEEAWNLDTKLDDGMPGAGKLIIGNITTCANATSNTDYAATYRLNSSSTVCVFYFTNAFND
jgi:prepilin-type N-terminal cleavage/methylation domain-containing protein